jgi:GDP-4-dehydro-6-deoxy-D-mannose reductase
VADLAVASQARQVVAAADPEVVVHLAGGPAADRHELYRANVLTTVALLEAAAETAVPPHVVVVGSAAEYGEGDGAPITESAPLRPVTEYGRAKVAATTLAEVFARERNLSLAVARPFNVVSGGLPASTALGNLRRQLLDQDGPRRVVRCGRIDVVRDFVPLDFVTLALATLALGRHRGAYNLCSGIGIRLDAILAAMGEQLGIELVTEPQAELIALPAADHVVGSADRLKSLGLAVSPTPSDLARLCLAA